MDLSLQRGAVTVTLDRPRILFFDMNATWLLIQKFGSHFVPELYTSRGKWPDAELELKSMDALAFFLWAGLQADAKQRSEDFTLEQAQEQLRPFTYTRIFQAVVVALVGGTSTPVQPGKAEAPSRPAQPSASVTAGAGTSKGSGPTKVSTSLKRSGSPTRSSAGRSSTSGKRR